MARKNDIGDIAAATGLPLSKIEQVTGAAVRAALTGKVPAEVLEVAIDGDPATFWRAGDSYYFDDPFFGPLVDFTDLRYNSEIGLHTKRARR